LRLRSRSIGRRATVLRLLLTFCTLTFLLCGVGVARSTAASLGGVSCPSGSQCTAVDSRGGEVTFAAGSGHAPGTTAAPIVYLVDGGQGLSDVACPSVLQCTAVGSGGIEVTFDPTSVTPNNTYYTVDGGQNLSRVACPSTSQCTAVDASGDEVTFDPMPGMTPTGTAAAVGANEDPLGDVVCPSTSQCTAVGSANNAVTFTPGPAPDPRTQPLSDTGVEAVACPSVSSCVAVDDDGYESSFDPDAPTAQPPTSYPVFVFPVALACPGPHQCTAADGNSGQEETFDPSPTQPTTPTQTATSGNVDNSALNALTCLGGDECVAVDDAGGETTFNPVASDPTTSAVTIDSGAAVGNPGSNGGGTTPGGGETTPGGGTTGGRTAPAGGGSTTTGGGSTGGDHGAQPTGSENPLTLGRPTPADYGVNVPTTCSAGAGNCNVTANMSWVVGPSGYAASSAPGKAPRVVTVAHLSVRLRPGQHRVLRIRLNHVGRRLLGREHGRLHVHLTVSSNGQTVYSKGLQIKA
jgi:hypothetical protein